jgi:protein TonB
VKRALGIAAIVVAACGSPTPPEPPAAKPAPPAPQAAPAAPPIATLDDYKRLIAGQVLKASTPITFEGTPPHLLRAVVVLQVTVDDKGAIRSIRTLRTPDDELAAVATNSVRAAAPFPAPPPGLLRRGELEFMETWLFRDDGRFQVRSLAEAQGPVHQPAPATARR